MSYTQKKYETAAKLWPYKKRYNLETNKDFWAKNWDDIFKSNYQFVLHFKVVTFELFEKQPVKERYGLAGLGRTHWMSLIAPNLEP